MTGPLDGLVQAFDAEAARVRTRGSSYVRRERWEVCLYGPHCPHRPLCTDPSGDGHPAKSGRVRVGWVGPIRSPRQARREAAAWQSAGWAAEVVPATPEARREVRAWQTAVRKGSPR